jgi:ATP-dependent Clp protease ATP-binding subunit ClpA
VDFTDTILIFTSNIGTRGAMSGTFDRTKRKEVEEYYLHAVESHFADVLGRPEIFNRLKQGIVVFNYIGEATARAVIVRRLRDLAGAVGRRRPGLNIVFDPGTPAAERMVQSLLEATDFVTYGLRDVNNTLLRCVGGELARLLDDPELGGDFRFEWDGGRAVLVPGAPL